MSVILGLVRLAVALAAAGIGAVAIAAWFGFAVPFFDLFNHFQVVLIAGSLILLVIVLIAFTGLPSLRWPLTALLVLGLMASAITVVPETMALTAPRPPVPEGRTVLKLMTHNLFGLNYDMERVAALITREDPDIIALQEYFPEQRSRLDPLIRGTYPYSVYCVGGKRANIAIYAKLQFTQTVDGDCTTDFAKAGRTSHILATFMLAGGTKFAVLTTHFEWPLPPERLEKQLPTILAALKSVTLPLIVAGDFNATPWSYQQRQFASDTGLTRQTHGILTWPMRFWLKGWRNTVPFIPLDQIMSRGDVEVHDIHAGTTTGSDHLPLFMTFSVEK
jgi:endonuclease/exonuclease/phosphatase (EEP) superfamily protein YafD